MARSHCFLPLPLGGVLKSISSPLLSKQGFILGAIIQDWPSIIGSENAESIMPDKIFFGRGKNTEGVLYVRVESSSMAMVAHHLQPLLLEKINRYFGYQALTKLSIKHDVFFKAAAKYKKMPKLLTSEEKEKIEILVSTFPEGPLKESLKELGFSLSQHSS